MGIVPADILGEKTQWDSRTIQMNSQLVFTMTDQFDHKEEMELVHWLTYRVISKAGVQPINHNSYDYPSQGHTVSYILAASSLVIHTYPEKYALVMELSVSRQKAWEDYRNWLDDFFRECAFPEENSSLPVSLRDHLLDIQEHVIRASCFRT